jgi:hypothetical protein
VLAITVPMAGLAGQLILESWKQQQALVNRQNEERTRAIAGAVDQEVQNTVAQLRIISELEPIDASDLRSFHELAQRLVAARSASGWISLKLVRPDGQVLVDTGTAFGAPAVLISDDWVKAVRKTRQHAVSALHKDPEGGGYFVSIGVPVVRNDRLRFVLGVRVLASAFGKLLLLQQAPPEGVLALLDADLTIMARTRGEDRFIGGKPTTPFMQAIAPSPRARPRSPA